MFWVCNRPETMPTSKYSRSTPPDTSWHTHIPREKPKVFSIVHEPKMGSQSNYSRPQTLALVHGIGRVFGISMKFLIFRENVWYFCLNYLFFEVSTSPWNICFGKKSMLVSENTLVGLSKTVLSVSVVSLLFLAKSQVLFQDGWNAYSME